LADEVAETCVVGGVEGFEGSPLGNVHKSEACIGRKRAMKLVSKIPTLAAHVRVYLLPQGEKFVLAPAWNLEAVDQCYR